MSLKFRIGWKWFLFKDWLKMKRLGKLEYHRQRIMRMYIPSDFRDNMLKENEEKYG